MKTGICYHITADYLPYAIASLKSLRKFYPDIPCEIFTHQEITQKIKEPDIKIIKVNQPIVLNSKKGTVIRIKWLIPQLTSFDLFIISDVDMYYNTKFDDVIEKAEQGFVCVNPLDFEITILPKHFSKYNDGFIITRKDIFNQHFENLYQYWMQKKPNVWSSMFIFNEQIFLKKRANQPVPMYDIPEKYLWLIENKPMITELEPMIYHLAFGNENEIEKTFIKEHPSIIEFKKLMPDD